MTTRPPPSDEENSRQDSTTQRIPAPTFRDASETAQSQGVPGVDETLAVPLKQVSKPRTGTDELAPGDMLGRYRIEEPIGRGGHGAGLRGV